VSSNQTSGEVVEAVIPLLKVIEGLMISPPVSDVQLVRQVLIGVR